MFNIISDTVLLDPETIFLEPEDIQQASQNSRSLSCQTYQWDIYLQGLAVLSLQRWLPNRLKTQTVDVSHSTVFQPGYAGLLGAACNVWIGPFKGCIIATESIINGVVSIPQAAVEISEFEPHFYLIVEVIEEQEELIFRGLLRADFFEQYRQSMGLRADPDWLYRVPLAAFERDPNRLAFYAEYLNVEDLPLPQASPSVETGVMTVSDLQQILSGLSTAVPLWQQLTWEQAADILSSSALLTEFHQWQQSTQAHNPLQRVQTALESAAQGVINMSQWLESGLDDLAQRIGFMTAEQLPLAFDIRSQSLSETFTGAIATLREDGLPIPESAQPVFRTVEIAGLDLCLCLLPYQSSGALDATSSERIDWSLLVIVGSQSDQALPVGLQLQISRGMELVEAIALEFEEVLIYSSVDAKAGETLQVNIIAPNGTAYPLPSLTYTPGER